MFRTNFGLTNTTFAAMTIANGNDASNGGAVSARSPSIFNDVAVINSVSGLTTNVGAGGGGIFASATIVLNRSTISGNTGLGGATGGGLQINNSTATLNNVTISGNQVPGPPGTGVSEGGGIFLSQSTLNLHNVTITNNFAGLNGGGGIKLLSNSTVNVRNSIIAGNTSTGTGSAAGNDCTTSFNSTFNSLGYNLIGSPAGCNVTGTTTGNKTGVSANVGPLAGNGGPTQTHALLAGSPAVDAGNPAGCLGSGGAAFTADQRGSPRPFDGDGNGVAVCDMGAYEAQSILIAPAPLFSKSFSPSSVVLGGISTLTISITNTSASALTGLAFVDNFPTGLVVAASPTLTNTCGGTVTAAAGSTSLSLTNGSLGANATCAISIQVQANAAGNLVNTTGVLTSVQSGATGPTASASLGVNQPAPTPTPTTVVQVVAPPIIPQVYQNPAALGAIFNGVRATPQPRQSAGQSLGPIAVQPPVLRPPNTGDAGLLAAEQD